MRLGHLSFLCDVGPRDNNKVVCVTLFIEFARIVCLARGKQNVFRNVLALEIPKGRWRFAFEIQLLAESRAVTYIHLYYMIATERC